jgi:hypothetical protein
MRKRIRNLFSALATLVLTVAAAPASAEVITFEDLISNVPTSYHGLTWSGGFGQYSWVIYPETIPVFDGTEAVSSVNFAWSNGATDLSIASGTPFSINSLWARIGNLTSGTAIAHGFLGNSELYTQTLNLTDTYQFFALDFTGIDTWTLTDQANNVLIDNIDVSGNNVVPEPSSFALMVLGGIGSAMGAYRLRRKSTV